MLDIRKIRKSSDEIRNALVKRNISWGAEIDKLIEIDNNYRQKLAEKEKLESQRNQLSKEVGKLKAQGSALADDKINELNFIKESLKNILVTEDELAKEQEDMLMAIPNIPSDDTPEGKDEHDNIEILRWGEPRKFDFKVKEHHEIGIQNDILDFERGVKLAQSRFTLIRGQAVKLERALANFMLDKSTENGFEECSVPVLNNAKCFMGTGQFPKFAGDYYKIEDEDLYLIPTAEVPLTNIFSDEILDAESLPLRLAAHTPCFRKEAGSAGRDTRGIIRQHQFNKIELVVIAKPEQAIAEHERLTEAAESVLQALDLPYRKVQLCAGDMSAVASKCYDLEVWFPSQETYREISSCSWFSDYQARRAKIRYKNILENGKKSNELVHTINGSGLAVGRTLAAILENYQQADGSVAIPEVLKKYL